MKTAPTHSLLVRATLATLLVFALLAAGAQPADTRDASAELTVLAYGKQRFELTTGRNVLEDGGEVVDQRSGTRVVAQWIAYAEGDVLEARDAVVVSEAGELTAPALRIDLANGRVTLEGGVTWSRTDWLVIGDNFFLDRDAGVAGLAGSVRASQPLAESHEAWFELDSERVVLIGPYRYAAGLITLTGASEARLMLTPFELPDGARDYDADTSVDEELNTRIDEVRNAFPTLAAP